MLLESERLELQEITWEDLESIHALHSIPAVDEFNTQLHRIEAGVAVDNLRSIHVLEKAGMTREGRGRKILPIRGEWKDSFKYAIVEDEEGCGEQDRETPS